MPTTTSAPTQERSRRRREAILRAATELLAEGGAKAVTHRAVAARAGLPPATPTYYFESIQELTDEALRVHVSERADELRRLAQEAASGARSVEEIGRRLADSLADRAREIVIAQFEVYLEAARNPALRPVVAEALDAFEDLARALLTAMGARDTGEAAVAVVALADGFA